jgi:hypothetical protein
VTPSVSSKGRPDASETPKGLGEQAPIGCTTGCTSPPNPTQPDPVATLAAALLALSSADRARLAALLLGPQEGESQSAHQSPQGVARP